MDISHKKIGAILVENGLITEIQLNEALAQQRKTGKKLGEILVKQGWVSREEIEKGLNQQKGITFFNLSGYIIEPEVVKLIPEEFARKYKVMPVFVIENILTIAMFDPSDVRIIDEIQRLTKLNVEPVAAEEMEVRKVQDQYYGPTGSIQEIIDSIDKEKLAEAEKLGEEAPIIKIFN